MMTDEQTEYPVLPFLREHDLEAEVIKLLETTGPHFSFLPAIRHVRGVMQEWSLMKSKNYVDKIYENNTRQIYAAHVRYLKSWRREHPDSLEGSYTDQL